MPKAVGPPFSLKRPLNGGTSTDSAINIVTKGRVRSFICSDGGA